MFPDLGESVQNTVNTWVDLVVVNFGDTFESIGGSLLIILRGIEWGLLTAPPWAVILFIGLLAYVTSQRIGLALVMSAASYLIGALGLWDQAMQTVAIVFVSSAIAVIIGVPIGILMARSSVALIAISPILDLMQTIPSFVYLIPAAMLFGLGKVPAILATIIYSMPPLIRLTNLGLRTVDSEITEAACSFGAGRLQVLSKVQIPLAMPSIMQGVNQTMMMALSMVVVASMIGARGVGETVLIGLQRNNPGLGFVGGIVIVILAIIFDRISQSIGHRMQRHNQN